MGPESNRLRDVASSDIVSLPGDLSVSDARERAGEASWIVVTNSDSQPLGLLHASTLARAPQSRRVLDLAEAPAIVLPADLAISETLRTWPFRELAGALTDLGGIIVVASDDDKRPLGVWADARLMSYVFAAVEPRGGSYADTALGGTINIGRLTRRCHYTDAASGAKCSEIQSFPEKPDVMPPCGNPDGLTPHQFGWK